jgi:hypothetical protein
MGMERLDAWMDEDIYLFSDIVSSLVVYEFSEGRGGGG